MRIIDAHQQGEVVDKIGLLLRLGEGDVFADDYRCEMLFMPVEGVGFILSQLDYIFCHFLYFWGDEPFPALKLMCLMFFEKVSS